MKQISNLNNNLQTSPANTTESATTSGGLIAKVWDIFFEKPHGGQSNTQTSENENNANPNLDLKIISLTAAKFKKDPTILSYYKAVEQDKVLFTNFNSKNTKLTEYAKLASNVFGEEVEDFPYSKKVMLGILIAGYPDKLDELMESSKEVKKFLSIYLDGMNIEDFTADIIDKNLVKVKTDDESDETKNSAPSENGNQAYLWAYGLSGALLGVAIGILSSKIAARIRSHNYQGVPTDDDAGSNNNAPLSIKGAFTGMLIGGVASSVISYIIITLKKTRAR